MTYCLNVEGMNEALLAALIVELGTAFSVISMDGGFRCIALDATPGDVESAVSVHPEREESTVFVETNKAPVAFRTAVLGRIVAFLADRGCEVVVAEV